LKQDNNLDFAKSFKGKKVCVVCGSTWPEDEAILIPFINRSDTSVKYIIAPHIVDSDKIEHFRRKLTKPTALYSEVATSHLPDAGVLIIDTIGLLSKIYSYADLAYVGGAMGTTGLHNILEPTTFGVPIVIGQNFDKFPEAKRLQALGALFSVSTEEELNTIFNKLISDIEFREATGKIARHFVETNTGATATIMRYIEKSHSNGLI
jgi:3-deoxy-D-manno-octulosonic-acid transferase